MIRAALLRGRMERSGSPSSRTARSAASRPAPSGGHQRVLRFPGNNPRGITAGPDGNLWFTRARLGRCDRPHHHGRRVTTATRRRQAAHGDRRRAGWQPLVRRQRGSRCDREDHDVRHDHAVLERPDHRPARHRGRSRRQSVLHRERGCRADRADHDGRRDHRVHYRPDRRLRAVGHRERRRRQHLVHRERGESRREAQLRPWRRDGSGDADFAGSLPVAGDAIARSKRRADPPAGDAPGVRPVGDDRHGLRRDPRAAPGNRRLPPALRRLDRARGDDDRRHPRRAQADERREARAASCRPGGSGAARSRSARRAASSPPPCSR